MIVDSLLMFFAIYLFTQSDDFARAIAFAWRPFLPIIYLKLSHFSNIRSVLERVFMDSHSL